MSGLCLDINLNEVCRICLSQTDMNELLFNIFTDAIVDGMLVALCDVIEYCIAIKVKHDEQAPHKICQSCKTTIFQFYLFKQKCHRTHNLLRSILKNPSSGFNGYTDGNEIEEKTETITCQERITYSNDFDTMGTAASPSDINIEETIEEEIVPDDRIVYDIERENQTNDTPEQSPSWCPSDNFFYTNSEHQEEYYSDDSKEPSQSGLVSERLEVVLKPKKINCHVCNICGKNFPSQSRLAKHSKFHTDSNIVLDHMNFLVCKTCRMMFLREEDLNDHNRQSCDRFDLADDVHDRCRDEEQYQQSFAGGICGLCGAKFDETIHLKQHIITHLDKFPCPVEGCGCEYASLARLSIHISNQHVDYLSPKCPHCQEEIDRVDLRQHMRLYCKAKQFKCTHCDKMFLSSQALSQHLRNLEQTFQCSQCDKFLASHSSLRLHERTHTGERPYVCTVCQKSYKTASLRTAHMDTHIEGKTFKCSMCGKSLQTRASYRNHVKRHLEERNHACVVCGKKFFQKCTLRVHLKTVHRITHVPNS